MKILYPLGFSAVSIFASVCAVFAGLLLVLQAAGLAIPSAVVTGGSVTALLAWSYGLGTMINDIRKGQETSIKLGQDNSSDIKLVSDKVEGVAEDVARLRGQFVGWQEGRRDALQELNSNGDLRLDKYGLGKKR